MAKKSNVAAMPVTDNSSSAIGAVAAAISSVCREFESIQSQIKEMSNAIGNLGIDTSIRDLTDVIALMIIAQSGTREDRAAIVARLKERFNNLE